MAVDVDAHNGYQEHLLGDYRNFWWNREFLDLMADRLQLWRYRRLLDVGCGLCHWSRLLVGYLDKPAEIYGLDNNKRWTESNDDAEACFRRHQASLELINADAHSLPFEDGSFDIVTCQTLLIHLRDPALALQEMKRILRPGGMILCAEPNNRIQALIKSSFSANDSIDEILDHVKYALICERGKKKLGLGDSSLGDLLPGMLAQEGFRNIAVKLSDKAIAMYPPYDNKEQTATLLQWAQESPGKAGESDDRTYFKAFGEDYLDFYESYQKKHSHYREAFLTALADGRYHAAGGVLMYLVSGIK